MSDHPPVPGTIDVVNDVSTEKEIQQDEEDRQNADGPPDDDDAWSGGFAPNH